MYLISCRQILLAVLLFSITGMAVARTVRIPLPELLGPQVIDSLESHRVFSLGRYVAIPRSSLPRHFESIRFEWAGTIKAGRVVGDGIEREPIEQILPI